MIVAGFLGSNMLLHVVTGVVLLVGVPTAVGARVACVIVGLAYLVAAVVGAGDALVDVLVGAAALGAALVPAPRPEPALSGDLAAVADRAHLAYDASSPGQVFVGGRS